MAMIVTRRLQARYNLSNDAGTWQFKFPKVGLLSGLTVFLEWTNGSTSNKDEDIYDAVDRIEVIANGSKVIYSLTGQQARLWAHVHLRQRPFYTRDETPDVVQRGHFYIPFGLFKYDTQHYLDLSRFQDVELRITYSPTIAATSFVTSTGYVTVLADMWMNGPPGAFDGYLKCSEQLYFTSAASGDEIYDLPIGNDLLGVGLYIYESGIDPHANIDEVEINIDHGAWTPVIGLTEDLIALYTNELGIDPTEWGIAYKSDTDTIETRTGSLLHCDVFPLFVVTTPGTTDPVEFYTESYAGGLITCQTMVRDGAGAAADAAYTTDLPLKWMAKPQYGLGNFLCIPFGLAGAGFALPTATFGNVRVIMTQGNAGAECRLSTLELVRN
jgi:hypothetical protein